MKEGVDEIIIMSYYTSGQVAYHKRPTSTISLEELANLATEQYAFLVAQSMVSDN